MERKLLLLFTVLFHMTLFGQPEARDGVIDLRNYDFIDQGSLKIEGEWRFYWEEIIQPSAFNREGGTIIKVPSAWKELDDQIPSIKPRGFGSYYLKVLLPDDFNRMALRFTEVFSASGYYANGKNIGFNGFPGTNRFQSIFEYAPSMHVFDVKDTILELIVHVSNFEHRSGGIRGSVELGTPMQIMSARTERQTRDFFLIGAFLIIGIYFLGLYLMRSELYKLFFSLICLVMVFRILVLSDTDLFRGEWISGIARLRLEYLSFDLLVPLFVMMIRNIFPNDFPRLLYRTIIWLCLAMVVFVIFTPVSLFSTVFSYYFYFVIFAAGVVLYVIVAGWTRGRTYAPGFAIGIAVVIAGAVNDMMYISDIVNTTLISHYTVFIYLIIYSMIFSSKMNRDFIRAENLSAEIFSINETLEQKVKKRTAELSRKSQELMQQQEALNRSNKDLRREIDIRDQFLTIIGHDVKAPVGYTIQMLDMILDGQVSKKEEKEMLRTMASGSRATYALLENLLAWGRTQTGEKEPLAVGFKLARIMEEITGIFDLPVKEKKIHLEIDVPDSLQVYADKEHVKLIIRNFLSNAVKFTKTGGHIRISAISDKETSESIICVQDDGIGMSPRDLNSLFNNGEIHSVVGTQNEKGSGIGLKLCKQLAGLNKGSIHVESQLGEGTKFCVSFPSVN